MSRQPTEPGRPPRPRLSRRSLLAGAASSAGAAALLGMAPGAALASPPAQQPVAPEDPTKVQGRPPNRVGTRSPFERPERLPSPTSSRTPLAALDGIITPSDLHFERHHGGVAVIDPARHELLIHGLVDEPRVFTMADLRRFPSVSRITMLECSGNSGAAWTTPAPATTVQALHGLTSTSEWTGVPVKTLLAETGVKPDAKWVLAEGADAAVMTRSIPIEKILDDALIAYGQNGEPLRPEQGYPVRLFLPGWEGNMNVKWLRRLKLGDQPFMTREETSKYTDPMPVGVARQFTFTMEAKSTITRPSAGMKVDSPGFWEIVGIAWSGRGRITKVEVSVDGGSTWATAMLQDPVLPICHTRFRFGWNWDGKDALLMSRATDETGYVQPTRQQLVAVRGTRSIYHYNGITGWRVAPDGAVTYATA
ncbi:MAG: sulfite dehydrogenase [Dehalococcoidia bacterium]